LSKNANVRKIVGWYLDLEASVGKSIAFMGRGNSLKLDGGHSTSSTWARRRPLDMCFEFGKYFFG